MNMITPALLPDVQSSEDSRNLVIQRVGVKSVTYPVRVATEYGDQSSVAVIDMYVSLPAHAKGTHMSRFLEVLEDFDAPLSAETLSTLMAIMLKRLGADSGVIEMRMPYFVRKTAPVSGVKSLLDHQLTLRAEQSNGQLSITQQILTPVTSLCPCSKEISLYGAHNQRSHIIIAATLAQGAVLPPCPSTPAWPAMRFPRRTSSPFTITRRTHGCPARSSRGGCRPADRLVRRRLPDLHGGNRADAPA